MYRVPGYSQKQPSHYSVAVSSDTPADIRPRPVPAGFRKFKSCTFLNRWPAVDPGPGFSVSLQYDELHDAVKWYTDDRYAVQGHSKSLIPVPVEWSRATSYY